MRQAADNENETLSFLTLQAATRNVLRYLEMSEEEQKNCDRQAARECAEKQKKEAERAYITHRLREIAEWERRISGYKRRSD